MATTTGFKQACPSCEHPVPIRDPKLIGRKIDCPKCKYRFVVEEPADEPGDEDEVKPSKKKGDDGVTARKPANGKANGKAAPAKKPARRRDSGDDDVDDTMPKAKKGGGLSPIVLIGGGLALVAVLCIIGSVVYWAMSDDAPPAKTAENKQKPPEEQPPEEDPKDKVPPPPAEGDLVVPTNLLPNETEGVLDAKLDKFSTSLLGEAAFDREAFDRAAFARCFGFPIDSVNRHVQAVSFTQDWRFNVIHTRQGVDLEKLKAGLGLEKGPKSPIQGKEYFVVKGELDPFTRSWMFDSIRTKPVGVYKHDEQTLVLAELDPLERFLQDKAAPRHLSEAPKPPEGGQGAGGGQPGFPAGGAQGAMGAMGMAGAQGGQPGFPAGGMAGAAGAAGMAGGQPGFPAGGAGGAAGAAGMAGGQPGGPPNGAAGAAGAAGMAGAQGGQPGFPAGGMAGAAGAAGMAGGQPGFPAGGAAGAQGGQPGFPAGGAQGAMGMAGGMPGMPGVGPKSQPSAAWLTVRPQLKVLLDKLEESGGPTIIAIAEEGGLKKKGQGGDLLDLGGDDDQDKADLPPGKVRVAIKSKAIGIHAAQVDRWKDTLIFEYENEPIAQQKETDFNVTAFPEAAKDMEKKYGIKVSVVAPQAGFGMQGMMGGFPAGGAMGAQGGFPAGGAMGAMGMGGAQGGQPGFPAGGAAGMAGGQPGFPAGGAQGGQPGFPAGGGQPGFPAGGAQGGMPGFPAGGAQGGMQGFPAGGAQGGMPGQGGPPKEASSTLGATHKDSLLVLTFNIALNKALYKEHFDGFHEQMMIDRAETEMAGGRRRVHQLAAALKAYADKHGAFPQGAYNRPSTPERAGRPWAPDQRVSWLAEVLRYLPQYAADFANDPRYPLGIDPTKAWSDDKNLKAAHMLVPQFLAPTSTKSQWWVDYPNVAKTVSTTNFVGVAGVGLDAADEDTPANKRGVFGYDRVTRLDQITDGPALTIAVLQVPPQFKTPWLAGGGATVRGVPEKDSVLPFVCDTYEGKPGTYAVMANGDVRFVRKDIPEALFQALCTIAGGEPIDKKQLEEFAPLVKPDANELKTGPLPPRGDGANAGAIDKAKLLGKWVPDARDTTAVEFLPGGKLHLEETVQGKVVALDGTYQWVGDNKLALVLAFNGQEKKETLTVQTLTDQALVTVDEKGKSEGLHRKGAPPAGGADQKPPAPPPAGGPAGGKPASPPQPAPGVPAPGANPALPAAPPGAPVRP